jgi:hypothetical protein
LFLIKHHTIQKFKKRNKESKKEEKKKKVIRARSSDSFSSRRQLCVSPGCAFGGFHTPSVPLQQRSSSLDLKCSVLSPVDIDSLINKYLLYAYLKDVRKFKEVYLVLAESVGHQLFHLGVSWNMGKKLSIRYLGYRFHYIVLLINYLNSVKNYLRNMSGIIGYQATSICIHPFCGALGSVQSRWMASFASYPHVTNGIISLKSKQ